MTSCRGHAIEASTSGVTVTLIDFTLSRLTAITGDVAFCDLAADPELFTGPKGDVQVNPQTGLIMQQQNTNMFVNIPTFVHSFMRSFAYAVSKHLTDMNSPE